MTATLRRFIGALALLLVALGATGAMGAVSGPVHASGARAFSLVSLDTVAIVNPDGSMDVVEEVTYSFSGTFTVGIRSFDRNEDDIRDFRVTDETGRLRVERPSESLSGDWEWFFDRPIADAVHTFTVTYTVEDAVVVGPDVAELYWQFIGDDHPGISRMSVRLDVPGDAPAATIDTTDDDATVLRAWGHGPSNGRVELGRSSAQPDVLAVVDAVSGGAFVELRVLVPSGSFTVEPTGGPRLPGVLAEEGGFIDAMTARPDPHRDLGRTMAPIAAVTGLVAMLLLWFGFGREPRPVEVQGEYWREPLDVPPAVALVNLEKGDVPQGQAIAATIIDMAQRGYLTIEAVHEERFGPDKRMHVFRWTGKPYDDSVRPFEKKVMEMVFHGETEVIDDQITDWAKANRSTAASRLNGMTTMLTKEYERRGYGAPTQGLPLALLAVVSLLVGGAGVLALVFGTGLGWIAIAAAIGTFVVGISLLSNRSQAGVEDAARARGLKRYLEDFSALEDAPVGHLILWERYLVFAVAFGVADDLMRGLSTRLPGLLDDPAFGGWYIGPRGRFGRFDRLATMNAIGSDISSSFTPPSSSGSGGGFSGGGGGGGGGGGFGAR